MIFQKWNDSDFKNQRRCFSCSKDFFKYWIYFLQINSLPYYNIKLLSHLNQVKSRP